MNRRALPLLVVLAALCAACPGAKSPQPPSSTGRVDGPVAWKVSKSGLGFRLSNADDAADAPPERRVTPSVPLRGDDAKKLLARLPAIARDPDDAKEFALREKSIPAPRTGKTVSDPFPPPPGPPPVTATPAGPLVVERHAPDGAVPLAPNLSVTFNQPMVPVSSVAEIAAEKLPLTLSPMPEGKWRWLGTKTVFFQPEKRFPMATEYTVEVPAGTRSASGQELAKAERWTFSTPPIAIKRSFPSSRSTRLEPVLFVELDQQVDPRALLASIELAGPNGAVPIRLAEESEIETDDDARRLVQSAEKGRWIAFKPVQKLNTATSFKVHVKAGAPSAEGPRKTTADQTYGFSTFGPMRLARSQCSYHDACRPMMPFHLYFTNGIEASAFDAKLVTVSPELPGMKVEVHGSGITVSGRSKGRTKYTVKVGGDLTDVHAQRMGQEASASFDVGPAEPALFSSENDMIVLDPSSPKALSVHSINEPGLRARVYAVSPSDWEAFQRYREEWERPRKLRAPGRLVYDKTLTPSKSPDELVTTLVDLTPALSGGLGQTVVLVEPTRAMPKDRSRPELAVWVQATELGAVAMIERDQVTSWITRLADGAPLSGVDIALLGGARATSDREGLARVPLATKGSPLLVATKGKDVAIVPDRWFGSSSFSSAGREDAVRWFVFDDRGMYKPGEEVRLKGWVRRALASRGGDLDAVPGIAGKTVAFKVRDPRYAEIGSGSATVDDRGGFDLAFKLPGNANLGQAHVELRLADVGLGNNTTNHGFQVEEFRTPEFEVGAQSSEGPHFVGKHAVATLEAKYYAGGGLPEAPVHWSVTRTTTSFTPPNRSDFHFGPEPRFLWGWWGRGPADDESTKTETWTSTTNAQGAHRLRVDFDALDPAYPMSLAFTGQVEDVNRQQWAGRTSMIVHPGSHYVGLRVLKGFVRAGENIDVDVVVSDIDGKLVSGRPVTVKAARLDWQQKGGVSEEKEVDVQTCETKSAAAGGIDTVRCSLRTTVGGSWRLTAVVTDESGRKNQTATRLYVLGDDRPSDRRLEGDRVSIVTDRQEYEPGAIADVLVLAPFTPAEGLLTVHRQGIVHVERFTMKSGSHTLKVKLDDALVPNAEIQVDLVGAAVRDDASGKPAANLPKRPAFASGSVPVKILPTSRTLAVSAKPRKAALEPGGKTTVDVEVKGPGGRGVAADVAVIVADEAVLALSSYKTPDPIAIFYSPRPGDVRSIGLRERVELAEPNLTSASGDSAFAAGGMAESAPMRMSAPGAMPSMPAPAPKAMASAAAEPQMERKKEASADKGGVADMPNTPIQVRRDFSALALFAPRVRTDAEGRASVELKLPDNLTRYRVMAVATSSDKLFGKDEATVTARLPLMVRPSAPRFLNFGDRFELPVVVQNQGETAVEVGVVARATNATLDEPAAKRVTIAAGDRAEVRFHASTVKAGKARFQIGVASGTFADASQVEVPVYTPATTEAFATYGEIDQGAIAQPVKMPANVFPQFGGLEITTSSTQLQALTDAVLYLVHYPFECNEQIASRVVSIAALRDVLGAFQVEGMPKPEEISASMKKDFEKLKRRQNGNGGWGFWQEQPWPYLSIHVAHALVRAKEKGYAPDETMLTRSRSYLRNVESHIPSWYGPDARRALVAYSLFVRKKMGDPDLARARRLAAEAGGYDKLPIEAVGWIWPTISGDKAAAADNELIRRHVQNRVTETAGAAHFVGGYKDSDWVLLSSDRRADGVLLDALIGDQPQSSVIPKLVTGLLAHRKQGRWQNTNESAFVLLALDRYFNTYEKVTPDFVARVWLGDRFAGEHAFKGRTTERHLVSVPMQWLATEGKGTQRLVLGKDGPGRLYYRIGMQYAPTDLKMPPADHGFVVSRVYEGAERPEDVKRDEDGTWRVKAGAKVRVRVSMVAPSRRYHVALVDSLPAGFEPLNPSLAVTGEIPKDPQAADSKRGWWYGRTWYEHQNMRDERVEAFASLLYDGVWDYTYVARATTPGTFVAPPPKAEEMYSPETFGRGAGDRVIVE